jgi:glycosyltransferase involved in cell wall biosynthesis
MEVVVVVDGPDDITTAKLGRIGDPRLRVIVMPNSVGGSAARNAGVEAARGEWIAFLDDDDEWLPQKTEVQLAIARQSRHRFPVVSSRFVARTPNCEYIWPRRVPSPGENISNYLFSRTSLFQGEGLLATPTLFTKRNLLLEVPFRNKLKKHQDWDWVIRAAKREGAGFEFSGESLVVVRMGTNHKGISNTDDWHFSLDWIRERRDYVSPSAYAAFLLIVVADQASRQATLAEYLSLARESWRHGEPNLFHFLLYAGIRLFPRSVRHDLRRRFKGHA